MKKFFAIVCVLLCLSALAGEVIPPAPAQYFNDYANVVSSSTVSQLNRQLEQFERDSSCQIVVAVYSKMQTDSSMEDYTTRIFTSWKIGQKGKDNGAALFVFIQDRKMFIKTGYGLEGAMPDAICKRIIENEIKPRFKTGDYDGGLTAGVNAMLAAAKGEYRGTGRTVSDNASHWGLVLFFLIIFIIIWYFQIRYGWGGGWSGGRGGWSDRGSWGSGGGGGGSDGFSGGGGRTGGGGAGGSW
jgi:uncharacterized protein